MKRTVHWTPVCCLPELITHNITALSPLSPPKPSDSLVVDIVALSFTYSSRSKDIILYNWITDTMWWSLGAKENKRNIHMGVKSGPLWLFPVEVGFQNHSLQAYLKVLQQASSFSFLSRLPRVGMGRGSFCQTAVFPGPACQGCLSPAFYPQSVWGCGAAQVKPFLQVCMTQQLN